jgi:hypothetical protein
MAGCEKTVFGVNIDVLASLVFLDEDKARIFDDFIGSLPFEILEDSSPSWQVSSVFVEL